MRRVVALCAVIGVVVALGVVVNKGSGGENPPTGRAGMGSVVALPPESDNSNHHDHSCPGGGTKVAGVWKCDTGNVQDAVMVSQWPFDATPTDAQRKAATRFASAAVAGAAPYADYNFARANGYTFDTLDETVKSVLGTPLVSEALEGISQGVVTHLISPTLANDGIALDPTRPDALIYATDGSRYTLTGVMFMVPNETRAPQPGGPLTMWHSHKNPSCLDRNAPVSFRPYLPGDRLYAASGACLSGMLAMQTGLMLHVWLDPPNLAATFSDWGNEYVEGALRPGRGTIRKGDGPEQIASRTR